MPDETRRIEFPEPRLLDRVIGAFRARTQDRASWLGDGEGSLADVEAFDGIERAVREGGPSHIEVTRDERVWLEVFFLDAAEAPGAWDAEDYDTVCWAMNLLDDPFASPEQKEQH